MKEAQALEELARALASKVQREKPVKPRLRLVRPAQATRYDSITRESIIRRVRFLARSYRLNWLLEQETFNVPAIECLEDDALCALLHTMERGRECIADGISFEEADLVRSNASDLPADF